MQLVAAFVSQSSCIQEFSLGLKNTLIIREWLRARAAGPELCRLNLAAYVHQRASSTYCVCRSSTRWKGHRVQWPEL